MMNVPMLIFDCLESVTKSNFGPLIAYLVPGVTALWGLQPHFTMVAVLFAPASGANPTVGGFLYLTLAAIAMGMTVSAIRWVIVDRLLRLTGIVPPQFNFARLGENVAAYEVLNHIHYQHYLFYANMLLACAVAYLGQRFSLPSSSHLGLADAVFLVLELVFFITSRDTLQKYYQRVTSLLESPVVKPKARVTSSGSVHVRSGK